MVLYAKRATTVQQVHQDQHLAQQVPTIQILDNIKPVIVWLALQPITARIQL